MPADATVHGGFELSSEEALRSLTGIRDRGREADTTLANLGRRLDEISRKRATPRIELTGFDRVNAQLSEIEARLDRIDRKRASPRVALGGGIGGTLARDVAGGFGGGGGGGGSAGGGGLLSSLGGRAGMLPWWAAAAPLAPALLGGATSLVGSATSATLGAGTLGLGALGALGPGGITSMMIGKDAVKDLQAVTKAQTTYNNAVKEFGAQSRQAATAKRTLDMALVSAPPGAAGAARQVSLLSSAFSTATRPAYQSIYGGIAQGAFNLRQSLPTTAPLINTSAATTATAGANYSRFLTDPQSLRSYGAMTASFRQDLPIVESTLENITRTFLNLSVAALPFFHEANVWVNQWTKGMAQSSGDTARVQERMTKMVDSAKDWGRLLGAAGRTLSDLFQAGAPSGDSMVVKLTDSVNTWDRWIRNNPQKVRTFFTQAEQSVSRIATVLGNLTGDVFKLLNYLTPIFSRAEQFISFASGLGPGGLATGAALLYGGYQGARGALGGRGPSAGALLGSFILGSGGPAARGAGGATRVAGGEVVGGTPATQAFARASNVEVARGVTNAGAFLMGPASVGAAAVLARRQAAADVALAEREAAQAAAARPGLSLLGGLGGSVSARVGGAAGLMRGLSTVEGRQLAAAGAADAFVGIRGLGQGALGGALRFALPVAAITLGMQALQTPGGFGAKSSTFVQQALGFVPGLPTSTAKAIAPTTRDALAGFALAGPIGALGGVAAGALFHPVTAGASLGNPATAAATRSIANQAGAVRTTDQLAALQTRIQNVRIQYELPTDQRKKLEDFLRRASTTAAQNAGAAASNTWADAFQRGLARVGPTKAVNMMLAGIHDQLQRLGPEGRRAFATSTAQWVRQLELDNPKLTAPLERLMRGIVRDMNDMVKQTGNKMKDLQNTVFYFDGQIWTGTDKTWGAIRDNLGDKAKQMQERLSGIWGTIQQEAIDALKQMGFSDQQAKQIVTQTASGGKGAANANAAIMTVQATGKNVSPLSATAPPGLKARGGVLGGAGLLDTVPTPDGSLAAPGEAWIANRHTMNDLSRATIAMYGKTAWEMIRDESRAHSDPTHEGPVRFTSSPHKRRTGGAAITGTAQSAGGSGNPYVYGYAAVEPMSRTDQGLDYSGAGPIYAVGSGRVTYSGLWPGWPGSGGVVYQLDSGQYAGRNIYNMEHVRSRVSVGQHINAGQYIADLLAGYPWLEAGWANASSTGPLTPYNGAADGTPMPGGIQFKQFMLALKSGGALPAGIGPGGGGAVPQLSLKAPLSGLKGIPGAYDNRVSQIWTAAFQQKANERLSAMGGVGAPTGPLSGSVENQVYQFMSAAGFNKIAIAGMLGNAQQESSMNPNAPGGGLWQQISNFGSGTGGSLGAQMAAMLPQIQGLKGAMNAAGSPGQAATIFEQGFERAGIPAMGNRIAAANAAFAAGYARGGRVNWAGWHAKGGDWVTQGPTVFGAGEGGRKERVTIGPAHASSTRPIAVHIENLHIGSGDAHEVRKLGEQIAGEILDALDRSNAGTTDAQLAGAPA